VAAVLSKTDLNPAYLEIEITESMIMHNADKAQEQLDFLRAHGCNEFQGYYFSRPVPAEQFARLLQTEGLLRTE
jgi:EAL domain-containing protein (putative c-di-GMP-specific phosphodiesterase class I)